MDKLHLYSATIKSTFVGEHEPVSSVAGLTWFN